MVCLFSGAADAYRAGPSLSPDQRLEYYNVDYIDIDDLGSDDIDDADFDDDVVLKSIQDGFELHLQQHQLSIPVNKPDVLTKEMRVLNVRPVFKLSKDSKKLTLYLRTSREGFDHPEEATTMGYVVDTDADYTEKLQLAVRQLAIRAPERMVRSIFNSKKADQPVTPQSAQ